MERRELLYEGKAKQVYRTADPDLLIRHQGKMLLADEICPDTCGVWDKSTREQLDEDRFRRDLGGVEEAYQEVARRICGVAA
jgi:phosphoribosylaminoimidazole-succinocarboxamide synthase